MRRNAVCLLTSALMLLTAVGCSLFKKPEAAVEPNLDMADSYIPPEQDSMLTSDPYPAYGSPVPVESTYEPPADTSTMGTRYHTVVKRDTLYGLARMYYGDQKRWKDIYEANRSTISDPNRIRIGQRLVIP